MTAISDKIASDLSSDQLRDVVDVLRQPLSGRKVVLPHGPQAFFAAKLTPQTNDAQEEMVQVKLHDGNLRQMTRSEARFFLEEEYKERTKPKKLKPPASALKKSPAAITAAPPAKANTNTSSGPFSFYDIREEIDDSGNRIGGEAIDITRQLRQMETIADPSLPNASRPLDSVNDHEDSDDAAPSIEEDSKSPRKLDRDEYEALAARLDQLARLEEMAEQDAAANQHSRKKLSGSTWSKGFLNKTKTAKVKPITFAPAADKVMAVTSETKEPSVKSKVVAFADTAPQVKEIPRIGERSIREEQQVLNQYKKASSGWSKGFLNNSSGINRQDEADVDDERSDSADAPPPLVAYPDARPAPVKSFDERVFSSVVTEHVVTEKQPQEPPDEAPKKLSKFAQRRLEAMQQE